MNANDLEASVLAMQRTVGGNVRRFRLALSLSVDELAERVDTDVAFVTAVEDGRTDIGADMLVDLAEAVGTEIHVLVAPEMPVER